MVEVLRVRRELGNALREAEASRAWLVQIGYEERRRLERDLPLPIDLAVDDVALPDDVATTAYSVTEAVTNAVKHSDASRIV